MKIRKLFTANPEESDRVIIRFKDGQEIEFLHFYPKSKWVGGISITEVGEETMDELKDYSRLFKMLAKIKAQNSDNITVESSFDDHELNFTIYIPIQVMDTLLEVLVNY